MPRITDNTIIRKRIDEVRNIMKKNSTDLYIVFWRKRIPVRVYRLCRNSCHRNG